MTYFFDGTKEGFLTTFAAAYTDREALITSKQTQLLLCQTPIYVKTNPKKAERVQNRLLAFDRGCLKDLDSLLRCGIDDNEQIAFEYFRLLATQKQPVSHRLAEPCVFTAMNYIKKVHWEVHKFHGFVRFMETNAGALYAPLSPDNDICDLLLPHFRARMPELPFVLHDVKRKKTAVYDGKNSFIAPLEEATILLSADEMGWQSLWKEYYHSVNIPSRERQKQMRGYMPTRYWKFLPEKQEHP